MVAKVITGKSIRGALSYNEQKVRGGKAEIILAVGFSTDVQRLGFSEKLLRFEELNQRNAWISTNTVHISLNFPADEQLRTETLQQIATDYMHRIGFGEQPFLVYRHDDSHHPHIHIVTTSIQPNGKPIRLHNIGSEKSEPARKAIEIEYGLVIAESRKKLLPYIPEPVDLRAVLYSEGATKAAITHIVREATRNYKFTSLQELNAILHQFNVTADPGQPGSPMFQNRGLVYSLLDENGFKTGLSIKASSLPGKPTLKELDRKFKKNQGRKLASLPFTRRTLDTLLDNKLTPDSFLRHLAVRNLRLQWVDRPGDEPPVLQVIDNRSRAVFSIEELGWPTDVILNKLAPAAGAQGAGQKLRANDTPTRREGPEPWHRPSTLAVAILKTLLTPTHGATGGPGPNPRKKKKKRNPWPS